MDRSSFKSYGRRKYLTNLSVTQPVTDKHFSAIGGITVWMSPSELHNSTYSTVYGVATIFSPSSATKLHAFIIAEAGCCCGVKGG